MNTLVLPKCTFSILISDSEYEGIESRTELTPTSFSHAASRFFCSIELDAAKELMSDVARVCFSSAVLNLAEILSLIHI